MHEKVFEDAFILHDESSEDPWEPKREAYFKSKLEKLKIHRLNTTIERERTMMQQNSLRPASNKAPARSVTASGFTTSSVPFYKKIAWI